MEYIPLKSVTIVSNLYSVYNYYGLTKLMGEFSVRTLSNFCIIRTRFFDPDNIPFAESANDIFHQASILTNL